MQVVHWRHNIMLYCVSNWFPYFNWFPPPPIKLTRALESEVQTLKTTVSQHECLDLSLHKHDYYSFTHYNLNNFNNKISEFSLMVKKRWWRKSVIRTQRKESANIWSFEPDTDWTELYLHHLFVGVRHQFTLLSLTHQHWLIYTPTDHDYGGSTVSQATKRRRSLIAH